MNEKVRSLNMALNDLLFEQRMFRKDQREFIRNGLVQDDLDIIREAKEANENAFNNREDIVLSDKNEDGKFSSRLVSSDSINYEEEYRRQVDFLNRMMDCCEEIMQYLNEPLENETDEIMNSLYSDLGIEAPKAKEEVEILTLDEPKPETELDKIMDEIHEKASYPKVDETELERIMQEVHDKADNSDSEKNIDNPVNHDEDSLKETIDEKPRISKIAERRALRLKDCIETIDRYYNKFESKNGFTTVSDFDEGINFVQSDLENDITFLNDKISFYENLYNDKKPIVIPIDGKAEIFVYGSDEYDMGYNYICTEINLSLAKGEFLHSKYFHKNEANKPDINYAMEMMFNEIKDTFDEIEKSIDNNDSNFNVSMQTLWTECSIKILNNLKSDLENDYKNGKPLKLTSINVDGLYEVMTVENTKNNYKKQLNFLEKVISDCESLNKKLKSINNLNKAWAPKKIEEKNVSGDIDKKYVIAKKDGITIIIGTDITKDDIKHMKSPILEEAKRNKDRIVFSRCNEVGLCRVKGILVEVHEDGTIGIGGDVQKIEFHNQDEVYRPQVNEKRQSISSVVDELFDCERDNNIGKIMKLFKNNNPSLIWREIGKRISEGKLSVKEFLRFRDYLIDNYDVSLIISDNVLLNDDYKKLSEKYKNVEYQDSEYVSENLDDLTTVLPKDAKRVKVRKEKKSLMERFKELKTWKKVAIVAGLSIAGIAIIGTGVYHLVPGVKPMIDGFIQNINPNHVNDAVSQVADSVRQTTTDAASQTSSASVDYSFLKHGHTIFGDAFSAVSGHNPQIASSWFNNNPLDVFNTATNQFMHLTSEQLHDAEFLKTLAGDPNNAVLFGKDMANPDGFVSLADIASEIVKGGKVL